MLSLSIVSRCRLNSTVRSIGVCATKSFSRTPPWRNQINLGHSFAARDEVKPEIAPEITPETKLSTGTIEEGQPTEEAERLITDLETLSKYNFVDKLILKSLERSGFNTFTEVQQRSLIPILEEEKGVVCRAKTGTGKTLTYIIPTMQAALENYKFRKRGRTHALVICPTRDLATQVYEEYQKLVNNIDRQSKQKYRVELHVGGKKQRINRVYAPAIIIATPGRLNQILDDKSYIDMFSHLRYRVYDEADRLLDEGFSEALDRIDDRLALIRAPDVTLKSILFSATVNRTVDKFAKSVFGRHYKFVNCVNDNEPEAHENIRQELVITNSVGESFNGALGHLMRNLPKEKFKAIVFLPTITASFWFHSILWKAVKQGHLPVTPPRPRVILLNGQLSQSARERAIREFKACTQGVLVCTDVAARGLHINDVSDIVQMSPSVDIADYIHKVGRTARNGALGKATLFLSANEKVYLKSLQDKRGVVFTSETEYENAEEDRKLVSEVGSRSDDIEEFIPSFLSYYKLVSRSHGFNFLKTVGDIIEYYRFLIGDELAKFSTNSNLPLRILGLNPREAQAYFDVPGGFRISNTNNRSSKRTFYDDGNSHRGSNYRNNKNYSNRNNYGRNFRNDNLYSDGRSFRKDGLYSDGRSFRKDMYSDERSFRKDLNSDGRRWKNYSD